MIKKALTFEDILLVPRYSEILPKDTNLATKLTKNISLNLPFISAAMDTVTESAMAIAMARLGGIGIIHKNMSIENQVAQVKLVKKSESGIIHDPIFITKNKTLKEAKEITDTYKISGVPVVDESGVLIGILTNRDMRFETDLSKSIETCMTKMPLITAKVGITLNEAKEIMHANRIEKLPIVDENNVLKGLITIKDIHNVINYPNATKDSLGRLRVGAAISGNEFERAFELKKAGVDVLVLDSAHGHSKNILDALRQLKKDLDIDIIVGNIVTKDAALDLIKAGADALKVGIGPGSICTTRIIAGVGMPQVSAIIECTNAARDFGVPIIADGGIRYSGDVAKALAVGASSVMMGSILASTYESPGDLVHFGGRQYKSYRGMGSLGAMSSGSSDRYFQDSKDAKKLVPEGIEGRVPFRGKVRDVIYQIEGGLRSAMGYMGSGDIKTLQSNAEFVEITQAGLKESHVHDVVITKEAPNYFN
ncbi:MAG: IMP dehydrogenase [Helicobacter sp.]|nr:IMP dehydrogenase [Helicobacter sp.]